MSDEDKNSAVPAIKISPKKSLAKSNIKPSHKEDAKHVSKKM